MELRTVAYPKVNIGLYIGKKRADGYHSLISIFHIVEDKKYFDEIDIKIDDSKDLKIEICGLDEIADSKNNTVFKACSLFFAKTGIRADVHINVKKGIPSLAGLGGGSSDAGAVLLVLNSYYGRLNKEELNSLALEIGSDVPFFVSGCQCAVVEGRGEIITPIKPRNDLVFKLVGTDFKKVGTGFAYEQLDRRSVISKLPLKNRLIEMYYKPVSEWTFYNDFHNLYKIEENLFLTGSGAYCFSVEEL